MRVLFSLGNKFEHSRVKQMKNPPSSRPDLDWLQSIKQVFINVSCYKHPKLPISIKIHVTLLQRDSYIVLSKIDENRCKQTQASLP